MVSTVGSRSWYAHSPNCTSQIRLAHSYAVLALKFIVVPVALYYVLEFVKSILKLDIVNPFGALVFLSHPVADSPPGDPRYQKGWSDIPFVLYYIFWIALFRSIITTTSKRIAMYFGLKSETKLDRFGEQGYAMVYGSLAGLWGIRIMSTLPTWWFKTEYYWIDYPHWDMKSELKRYYLIQSARWLHELLIMILGVEKPRKDFFELILHHIVTLWLIFWSYLVNLTLIGNGIFVTMDISEVFLDFSMILNYLQMKRSKLVAFFVFFGVWTYLRHYVNIKILYSVWVHFGLIPESARQWLPSEGAWMVWWMKYQIWTPIFALQLINLFWYYLMWRILIRSVPLFFIELPSILNVFFFQWHYHRSSN
ncbi:LAG1-domain-containing protein [Fistulina hepatica ATCC 64428]|nr:LAG1-domain-containing protein [Fistulina hepatica ATCC 64428]